MELPAAVGLYVGVDLAWTPYGDVGFSPDTTCETTRSTELDPTDEDFGTHETTTCTTAEGWTGASGDPGRVFPSLLVGGALERDRLRLAALFGVGPVFAAPSVEADRTLTPDLALGGQFSLEGIALAGPVTFAAGALGSLRAFSAHGTHDDTGDTRLSAVAQFGAGPTLSVGLTEPGVLFRLYGVYTTGDALGAGVAVTWAPVRGAVE
jgi:hypothetical protein